MSLFSALKRAIGALPPGPADQLYAAVVAEARRPDWYLAGEVPDTMDGRFDMVALILSLLLLRLESEAGPDIAHPAALMNAELTERFIRDMDGNLRQDGVGDQTVGKHIGRMVAALGGRIGAYRETRGDDAAFGGALRRNLWRGGDVREDALAWVVREARRLSGRLDAIPFSAIAAGRLELGR